MNIEDSIEQRELTCHGRTIRWYLRKSVNANAPTMLIFHGHGYTGKPAHFSNPNWNIVCPMDDFGYEHMGCWFLGEDGDFFWPKAMSSIIDVVRKECGHGRLYCWGSSMGGYAALLYGYLHNAFAVYACVPQTWLYGSAYGNANKIFLDPIFDGRITPYNKLRDIFLERRRTIYCLVFSALEGGGYVNEQCFPLIECFYELRQPYYLEVLPTRTHKKHHTISQSLALINKALEIRNAYATENS